MKIFNCETCGKPKMKQIPAGVSKKTGKPYNAFMVCETCKAGDKPKFAPKIADGDEMKFMLEEILDIVRGLEDAQHNVIKGKGLPNATSKADEATSEIDLPF